MCSALASLMEVLGFMVKNISIVAKNDVFISYLKDNVERIIPFSIIRPYWNLATEEDFEGGLARAIDDKHIIATLLAVTGQSGAIIVWNTETESLEHISDGTYCEAVEVYKDNVYSLSIISHSFSEPKAYIEEISYGTMDTSIEPEVLFEIPIEKFDDYDGNTETIELKVYGDEIEIFLKGNVVASCSLG